MKWWSVFLFLLVWLGLARSISFNIVPDVKKCLREEVHKDVLVVGEYKLSDMAGQRTDITVRVATLHWTFYASGWVRYHSK